MHMIKVLKHKRKNKTNKWGAFLSSITYREVVEYQQYNTIQHSVLNWKRERVTHQSSFLYWSLQFRDDRQSTQHLLSKETDCYRTDALALSSITSPVANCPQRPSTPNSTSRHKFWKVVDIAIVFIKWRVYIVVNSCTLCIYIHLTFTTELLTFITHQQYLPRGVARGGPGVPVTPPW